MPTMITISGNAGRAPELRTTSSGVPVASFSVAVSERVKDAGTGQWMDGNTTWYRVSAWRELAENCAASIEKGMRVIVYGSIQNRQYENRDGEKRDSWEITAEDVAPSLKWVAVRPEKNGSGGGQRAREDEDPWGGDPPSF